MPSLSCGSRARFAAAVAPVADFQALRAARIMRSLYETILTRLERGHFPVLATPLKLKPHEKLFAILQASLASPQRENFF